MTDRPALSRGELEVARTLWELSEQATGLGSLSNPLSP